MTPNRVFKVQGEAKIGEGYNIANKVSNGNPTIIPFLPKNYWNIPVWNAYIWKGEMPAVLWYDTRVHILDLVQGSLRQVGREFFCILFCKTKTTSSIWFWFLVIQAFYHKYILDSFCYKFVCPWEGLFHAHCPFTSHLSMSWDVDTLCHMMIVALVSLCVAWVALM